MPELSPGIKLRAPGHAFSVTDSARGDGTKDAKCACGKVYLWRKDATRYTVAHQNHLFRVLRDQRIAKEKAVADKAKADAKATVEALAAASLEGDLEASLKAQGIEVPPKAKRSSRKAVAA